MSRRRIILIHGWNVRDGGASTVGRLAGPLRELGHEVEAYGYGWAIAYRTTRRRSERFAEILAPQLRPGDVLVAHSNGARIAYQASWRVCHPLGPMVWLHPALDRWRVPGGHVPRLLVYHSGRDFATRLARLVPMSPWGSMGTHGYAPPRWSTLPPDPRVVEIDDGGRHSGWALHPHRTAAQIHAFLERAPTGGGCPSGPL